MNKLTEWFFRSKQQRSVVSKLAQVLCISQKDVSVLWRQFCTFYNKNDYESKLGESKTLNRLESFVTYTIIAGLRPASILEVGTYFGRSTRRILDMKASIGLDSPVTCYDISNDVKYFKPNEASLILADITIDPAQHLNKHAEPRFIFLDARPYQLLKNVVTSYLQEMPDAVLTIHDCSAELCKRVMTINRSDSEITSATGVWERHVLAECFGVADPLSPQLDDLRSATHHLVIFNTGHGLALLIPNSLLHLISKELRLRTAGSGS